MTNREENALGISQGDFDNWMKNLLPKLAAVGAEVSIVATRVTRDTECKILWENLVGFWMALGGDADELIAAASVEAITNIESLPEPECIGCKDCLEICCEDRQTPYTGGDQNIATSA
ncbi:hypothetical protein KKF82_08670 [Patescibacteria group bacterium]|nr:hypothetical protein [Patescibacteria group bacterium]